MTLSIGGAPGRRRQDGAVTLTARQLNRSSLDRQLLLRRASIPVVDAVHRIVAIQAQSPASPYLALWNRIAGFDPADLDRAFADHAIVKATLIRITMHAVDAADYPAFHEAMQRTLRASCLTDTRFTVAGLSVAETDALVPELVEFAAQPRTNADVEAWLGERPGVESGSGAWWAIRRFAPLVHVATGGSWSFGYRPSYVAAPEQRRRRGRGRLGAMARASVPRGLRTGVGPGRRPVRPDPARQRPGGAPGDGGSAPAGRPRWRRAVRCPRSPHPGRGHAGAATADGDVGQHPARVRRSKPDHPAGLPAARHATERRRPADVARRRIRGRRLAPRRGRHRGDGLPSIWPTTPGRASKPRHASLLAFLADREPTVYSRYAHWWNTLPSAEVRVLGATGR